MDSPRWLLRRLGSRAGEEGAALAGGSPSGRTSARSCALAPARKQASERGGLCQGQPNNFEESRWHTLAVRASEPAPPPPPAERASGRAPAVVMWRARSRSRVCARAALAAAPRLRPAERARSLLGWWRRRRKLKRFERSKCSACACVFLCSRGGHRQTDRQADRRTDRQTGRQKDRQIAVGKNLANSQRRSKDRSSSSRSSGGRVSVSVGSFLLANY